MLHTAMQYTKHYTIYNYKYQDSWNAWPITFEELALKLCL